MQDLIDEMSKVMDMGKKMEEDFDNGIGTLYNPIKDNDSYANNFQYLHLQPLEGVE